MCVGLSGEEQDKENAAVFPEHFVVLELSDDIIKERAMAVPETEINRSLNSEEGSCTRPLRRVQRLTHV